MPITTFGGQMDIFNSILDVLGDAWSVGLAAIATFFLIRFVKDTRELQKQFSKDKEEQAAQATEFKRAVEDISSLSKEMKEHKKILEKHGTKMVDGVVEIKKDLYNAKEAMVDAKSRLLEEISTVEKRMDALGSTVSSTKEIFDAFKEDNLGKLIELEERVKKGEGKIIDLDKIKEDTKKETITAVRNLLRNTLKKSG